MDRTNIKILPIWSPLYALRSNNSFRRVQYRNVTFYDSMVPSLSSIFDTSCTVSGHFQGLESNFSLYLPLMTLITKESWWVCCCRHKSTSVCCQSHLRISSRRIHALTAWRSHYLATSCLLGFYLLRCVLGKCCFLLSRRWCCNNSHIYTQLFSR